MLPQDCFKLQSSIIINCSRFARRRSYSSSKFRFLNCPSFVFQACSCCWRHCWCQLIVARLLSRNIKAEKLQEIYLLERSVDLRLQKRAYKHLTENSPKE
ncbi:uncharacterized protein LOC123203141 isoform X2 [Mangifera indica]|uniref:uncharacterized protein LOC123203141 isoform X2 n=1 Tax=Mangifera indica TaxID=29780 RepID=UPI001CFA2A5E|nr:uncharacterized protein LOC123203141 isoform X2 [Mangifera indica]